MLGRVSELWVVFLVALALGCSTSDPPNADTGDAASTDAADTDAPGTDADLQRIYEATEAALLSGLMGERDSPGDGPDGEEINDFTAACFGGGMVEIHAETRDTETEIDRVDTTMTLTDCIEFGITMSGTLEAVSFTDTPTPEQVETTITGNATYSGAVNAACSWDNVVVPTQPDAFLEEGMVTTPSGGNLCGRPATEVGR